jgi:hypothetical protein
MLVLRQLDARAFRKPAQLVPGCVRRPVSAEREEAACRPARLGRHLARRRQFSSFPSSVPVLELGFVPCFTDARKMSVPLPIWLSRPAHYLKLGEPRRVSWSSFANSLIRPTCRPRVDGPPPASLNPSFPSRESGRIGTRPQSVVGLTGLQLVQSTPGRGRRLQNVSNGLAFWCSA